MTVFPFTKHLALTCRLAATEPSFLANDSMVYMCFVLVRMWLTSKFEAIKKKRNKTKEGP
jgi:hypothetical protein